MKLLAAAAFAVGGIGLVTMPPAARAQDTSRQQQPGQSGAAGQGAAGQSSAGQGAAGQGAAGQSAAGQSGSSAQQAGSGSAASAANRSSANKTIAQAADCAVKKDGLKDITKNLSRADRERLKELAQGESGQQLSQSVE
ncbi:MAG: hypothetical protein WBD40_16085, partial [Tepidisphaeraceae bacterium]